MRIARVLRPALFLTVLALLAVAFAPAGCAAFGMASPIVPGTAGGPWCAAHVAPPAPPPPATCPAACTGGCTPGNAACVVDGGKGATVCPPGMPCIIRCAASSCEMASLACPKDADCEVRCEGTSACQMASVQCPAEASCKLTCSATSTCQLSTMHCGHGSCRATCSGLSASVGRVDCGGSCDCTTSCDDGGMSMIAGMGILPRDAMDSMSPAAWTTKTEGQLRVQPRGEEAWTAAITECASGEPEGFHGVVVGSDGQPPLVLRIGEDPDAGLRAHVWGPGLLDADLTRASCRTLEGSVQSGNRAVNRVKLLGGSLTLDCTTPDGVLVTGSVKFDACQRGQKDVAVIHGDHRAITEDVRSRVGSFPFVAAPAGEPPSVRRELLGLRVVVHAALAGALAPGETQEQARRSVADKAREFAVRLGWVPVDEAEPHDVTMELAFSGHVTFAEVGGVTAVILPPADLPSLRLLAGGTEILAVPRGPRAVRCEVQGTGQEREATCAEWASRANDARLVAAINGSAALAKLASRRR